MDDKKRAEVIARLCRFDDDRYREALLRLPENIYRAKHLLTENGHEKEGQQLLDALVISDMLLQDFDQTLTQAIELLTKARHQKSLN